MNSSEVWYVSYGSNMSRERLTAYLAGGPVPGTALVEVGARDATSPRDSRPLRIRGSLYFADHSTRWAGGVGYLDPHTGGKVLARGWRITREQLADILAQEMRQPVGTDLPWQRILTERVVSIGPGAYETCVLLGHLEDLPLVTFTRPQVATQDELRPPSNDYLDMLARGMEETHGLTADQAHRHLRAVVAAQSRYIIK